MSNKTALELLADRRNTTPLELALDTYQMWYDANQALSLNKSYKIDNGQNSKRELTRADSREVKENLDYWENEIAKLQGASNTAPKFNTVFTVGCN